MECEFDNLIDAYHDGELGPPQVQQLEAHLPGCGECSRHLSQLRGLSGVLGGGVRLDPITESERLRLHQAIRSIHGKRSLFPGTPTSVGVGDRGLLRLTFALSALAASILLISAVWLSRLGPASGAVATPQASMDWEQVASTLQAEPRPQAGPSDQTAVADAQLDEWINQSMRGDTR